MLKWNHEKTRKDMEKIMTKNINPLQGKYDIGVIVGRFQVPKLTEGHKKLIDSIIDSHKQVIIVIGVSEALTTKQNPLGYIPRLQMLQSQYPQVVITHLLDVNSDEQWSKNLDTLIRSIHPIGSICLYGGRDSFIEHYHGKYPTFEFGITDKATGTQIRQEVGKEVIDDYFFRAGMIYQSQNQYPKVFPTVDVAVIKKQNKKYLVLVGKRTPKSNWRFPGGFVDPTDINLESAALRELSEEVDVAIDPDSIEYVGSNRQEDHRYPGPDEVITTVLFQVDYIYGNAFPKDENELCETGWIELDFKSENKMVDSHKPLMKKLLRKLKIKGV